MGELSERIKVEFKYYDLDKAVESTLGLPELYELTVEHKPEENLFIIEGVLKDITSAIIDGYLLDGFVENPEVVVDRALGFPEDICGGWDY